VQWLCRKHQMWSATVRKSRKSKRPGAAVQNDLIERDFTAAEPNQPWVGDIERHEALFNLAVVKGHRGQLVAAGW